ERPRWASGIDDWLLGWGRRDPDHQLPSARWRTAHDLRRDQGLKGLCDVLEWEAARGRRQRQPHSVPCGPGLPLHGPWLLVQRFLATAPHRRETAALITIEWASLGGEPPPRLAFRYRRWAPRLASRRCPQRR